MILGRICLNLKSYISNFSRLQLEIEIRSQTPHCPHDKICTGHV